MYSDAVYLFGTKFSSKPGFLDTQETLLDGTKVKQTELTNNAVLAAFIYLYDKKYIDIYIHEGKLLFIKTKTIKVKKLVESANVEGLEAVIYKLIDKDSDVQIVVRSLLRFDVGNPWQEVLSIVKNNLIRRGLVQRVEKGKVLFITTHKNILAGKIPKNEEDNIKDLQKAMTKIQSNDELYKKLTSAIANGIASRRESQESSD